MGLGHAEIEKGSLVGPKGSPVGKTTKLEADKLAARNRRAYPAASRKTREARHRLVHVENERGRVLQRSAGCRNCNGLVLDHGRSRSLRRVHAATAASSSAGGQSD